MERVSRRELIRQAAERARPKRVVRRSGCKGQWQRNGSCTVTIYDIGKDALREIVEEAIRARGDEIAVENHKVHLQMFEWTRTQG